MNIVSPVHYLTLNEYQGITDIKKRRKILDIYIDKVKVNYLHENQQHNIDIHYRYPLVNDGIEYTTNRNSKIKWDKWGKNYRIKKGDHVVSLSDIKGSDFGVDFNYSTVDECFRVVVFKSNIHSNLKN